MRDGLEGMKLEPNRLGAMRKTTKGSPAGVARLDGRQVPSNLKRSEERGKGWIGARSWELGVGSWEFRR